ncbi:hypothetical protein Tco_0717797 [Tanacetum coccineum]
MRTRSQARRRRHNTVRKLSVEYPILEKPDNPPFSYDGCIYRVWRNCFDLAPTVGFYYFGSGTLPGTLVTNPTEELKDITTRSGVTIQGPKVVNHDAEVTKDTMPPANNGSTEDVQPPVVQIQSRNQNPEPSVAPVVPPIPKASIPFHQEEMRKGKGKANDKFEGILRQSLEI